MKFIVAILSSLFLVGCRSEKIKLNSLEGLSNYKKMFDIVNVKRNNFANDYLGMYELSGLHLNHESIRIQYSFTILFKDNVVSDVDVIIFKHSGYAVFMNSQLKDQVYMARTAVAKNAHRNGIYVDIPNFRIYNNVVKGDTLYLFGIDIPKGLYKCNDCSVLSSNYLKNIDAICEALQPPK